ncbi:MAG: hypothetical protein HRU50_00835 [Winogradskyella sp.]|uniref:M56 family metallopeptidase n=1 Tax=Winogradskyella sp. TaxID=1883156 RepID=UPI0025DC2CC4|nr:M56 family metallopeptidase [Winogradskyella sp.]NRB58467.1 hypothetical protein [Winogradskyella sp.]
MEYLLKSTAVIAVFYLCFYFLLKRETFFNHNRWFLIVGLVVATLFPFLVIPIHVPIKIVEISNTNYIIEEATKSPEMIVPKEAPFNWVELIPILYCIGLSLFFIQFLMQFGSLLLLLIKHPKNKDGIYTYVIVNSKVSPFSFFKWIVYNPENYKDEELQLMLMHEKIHVKQWHTIDIVLTQLACVVFWFNPLIWLYRKEVQQNLEYIADYETQNSSNDTKYYQRLLLKTSVGDTNFSLSNNFYNSLIKERIVMLQKSRSNKRNRWKYLLILPVLTGLLLSMNTEKVFIENSTYASEFKKTIEFIVDKNTTDNELNLMSKRIEENGGTLLFSKLQRNDQNELTNIFVKLNNHSYGNGNFKSPIDDFIIYKEFFGENGGYVGRPHAATMHFDKKELLDEREYKKLEERAIVQMQKLGLEFPDNLLKNKEEKSKKNLKKQSTQKKGTSKNKQAENSRSVSKEISITLIDKNTTDSELEDIKKDLEQEGLTVKFKKIKRNKRGEITAIKIEAKSDKSSTSYSVSSSDEAIEPIKIVYNDENNSISIGNSNKKSKTNTYVYESTGGKDYKIVESNGGNNVIIITEEENDQNGRKVIINDKRIAKKIKAKSKSAKVEVITEQDGLYEVTVEEESGNNEDVIIIESNDGENIWVEKDGEKEKEIIINSNKIKLKSDDASEKVIIIEEVSSNSKEDHIILKNSSDKVFISTNGKDPLYIINDKEVSKEKFQKLSPDNIESITVLKDKAAKELYGKKAKHGVVKVVTKKK